MLTAGRRIHDPLAKSMRGSTHAPALLSLPDTSTTTTAPASSDASAIDVVIPVGTLNVRTGELRVALFDSLADPTWLAFTMSSVQVCA
jgi:hypothetical protein